MEYFRKIKFIWGSNYSKLSTIVMFFLIASIVDLLGIGIIGPYIAILISPESFKLPFNLDGLLLSLGLLENIILISSFFLFFLFFFKSLVGIFVNKIILDFGFFQADRLRSILMRKYFLMPYKNYVNGNSADYIYNITHLTEQYARGILSSILRLISEGITVIAIIILLFFQIGILMLFLIVISVFIIYLYDYYSKTRVQEYGHLSNKYSANMIKDIHEGIGGLKEIRSLNKERFFYDIFKENSRNYAEAGAKSTLIETIPRYVVELILVTFFISIVLSSGKSLQDFLPTLGILGLASMRLIPSVSYISTSLTQLRYGKDAVNRLYDDLKGFSESNFDYNKSINNQDKSNNSVLSDKFQSLEIRDISFSYENKSKPLINNLSLKIKAGDAIGIMGKSGSGKTTLIDILLGLLDVNSGDVLLNKQALKKDLYSLRSRVAYLPQQVFLIDSTIKNNIALGVKDSEISLKKLNQSIKKAKLDVYINQLENGINTNIGEKGSILSGGLRQRVVLARAFYFDKDILILDEATSSLDVETEEEILNELKALKGTKTIILIAHKKEILSFCDNIYVLNNAKLNALKS